MYTKSGDQQNYVHMQYHEHISGKHRQLHKQCMAR